jgi:hypothetical protein
MSFFSSSPRASQLPPTPEGWRGADRAPDGPGARQQPDGDEDALRRAQAERLQRYELERAADEGMTESESQDTTEPVAVPGSEPGP